MAQEIPVWRMLVIPLPGTFHSDPLGQAVISVKTMTGRKGEKGLQQLWCRLLTPKETCLGSLDICSPSMFALTKLCQNKQQPILSDRIWHILFTFCKVMVLGSKDRTWEG